MKKLETLVSVFQTFQNQTTASPSYFKTILKELAVFNLRTSKEQVVVQLVKFDFFPNKLRTLVIW
jgi:hypothetical protein